MGREPKSRRCAPKPTAPLLRVVWVLLFLFGGVGLLPYVVLWIVMPNE